MSISQQDDLESEDGDELVAYLDGELPADVNRRVEDRLASDADYREQLRELDQAWEALDALPRMNVGDDFARTTIEMVAQVAQGELETRTAQATKSLRTRNLRWAAVALAAAAVGFTAASILLPNSDKQLLQNLQVVRQFDLLSNVGDLEFLRDLTKHFSAEQFTRDPNALAKELDDIHSVSTPSVEKRETWVRNLTPEEKQQLFAEQSRFLEVTKEERQRLRAMSEEISRDKDADKLLAMLTAYGQWVDTKSENVKEELGKLPRPSRIVFVQQQLKRERPRLSADEKSKLRNAIRTIADENKDAMFVAAAQRIGNADEMDKLRKRVEAQPAMLELCTVIWALNNEETRTKTRTALIQQLDSEARDAANEIRPGGRGRPRDQLQDWIMFDVLPMRRNYNPQELMRYFAEDLNHETQKNLSELSASEFETILATRYEAERSLGIRDLEMVTGQRGVFTGGRQGGGPLRGARRGRGGPMGEQLQMWPPEGDNPNFDRGGRGQGGRGRGGRGNRGGDEPQRFDGERGNRGERGEGPPGEPPGPRRGGPDEPPPGKDGPEK